MESDPRTRRVTYPIASPAKADNMVSNRLSVSSCLATCQRAAPSGRDRATSRGRVAHANGTERGKVVSPLLAIFVAYASRSRQIKDILPCIEVAEGRGINVQSGRLTSTADHLFLPKDAEPGRGSGRRRSNAVLTCEQPFVFRSARPFLRGSRIQSPSFGGGELAPRFRRVLSVSRANHFQRNFI